ncbi:GNAT family acetyltransferase [Janibacter sp. Soil728]|uniref:GNAT family N-acetyltransferase n=1 Tax=Janibacter sp. Soil728 TaxID=1736393 RepID=UPI0006FC84EC|nr:GNAT family N-acetyltransferase [Janibacter sp. Soil728]KRE38843.1 GNAT family acetyltransferase [Janibacter sp. Soil728]
MSNSVSRQSNPDRFEVTSDDKVAGFAQFVDHDGRRVFFHTEIGEEFGGQGLAGIVVEEAVTATREEGLTLVAVCPYVKKWLTKHPEHADITSPVTPADLAAINA